ncbi:hypothetical protein ACWGJT_33595 [Streptomyces xantholiticus]|uniref:Uncharacterized protein n=1 Tax=Streptomyces xantholiticus TaxID=68285 RepID=A0ABV1V5J3_9ACTN
MSQQIAETTEAQAVAVEVTEEVLAEELEFDRETLNDLLAVKHRS